MANLESVRLSLLNAMADAFATIKESEPSDDPYGLAFSKATLGPLDDGDQRRRFTLGIVPGPERYAFEYPFQICFLTINVEFRATANRGDEPPGVLIEQVLGVVKRKLVEDRTWGGIAVDTQLKGTEIDLVTDQDRSALGVCVCEVMYRHAQRDPRDPRPAFD